MDIKKLFKKLVHEHPDLFFINCERLELKNCRWIIAFPDDNDALVVHDLRGITTRSFDFDFIHDRTTLLYGEWENQYYNDEIEAEQVILASAIHYNEIYPQAVKEHYNKQVEQALNNLD